jgi:hypothetical protein
MDNGYYSEQAVQELEALGFDPYAATGRQRHHAPESAATEPLPAETTAQEKMAAKLRTPEGKAIYARRKAIVRDDTDPRANVRSLWRRMRSD